MDVLGKALANREFSKGWYDYEAENIRNEEYGIRKIPPEYKFECEEHAKRPKVQTKINPNDRSEFEIDQERIRMKSFCDPASCQPLPNGNYDMKCYHGHYVVTRKELLHPHTPMRTVVDTCKS